LLLEQADDARWFPWRLPLLLPPLRSCFIECVVNRVEVSSNLQIRLARSRRSYGDVCVCPLDAVQLSLDAVQVLVGYKYHLHCGRRGVGGSAAN
jgi:hypothetical protein